MIEGQTNVRSSRFGTGAIDGLGKYLAWKRGLRLASAPTILSVDAFVTPAAGIGRSHRVDYVGQTSPAPLAASGCVTIF